MQPEQNQPTTPISSSDPNTNQPTPVEPAPQTDGQSTGNDTKQQPKPLAPKKSRKNILLILLVIVLVVVGAGVAFMAFSDESDDTTSTSNVGEEMQTDASESIEKLLYTDEVGKFTVQYPANWMVEDEDYNSQDNTKFAYLVSPTGLKINLTSNLGGRGFSDTCEYDESTGETTWTDDREGKCPYTKYYNSIKTEASGLNKQGEMDYVFIIDRSFTDYDDENNATTQFSVCGQLGDVDLDATEYGVAFIDPEISTYASKDGPTDKFIRACIDEFGSDESFLKREDVNQAREILASMKFI